MAPPRATTGPSASALARGYSSSESTGNLGTTTSGPTDTTSGDDYKRKDVENGTTSSLQTAATTTSEQQQLEEEVLIGPDLNPSRSALDRKLYRQILLPNGLQCILIQDTIAMHQQRQQGGGDDDAEDSDDDVGDDDEEEEEEMYPTKSPNDNKDRQIESDADDEDEKDEEDDSGGSSSLRDSAVAILVGVGSMYDPMECQGMAHLLEHLLFMGSAKYPTENDYESFVSKAGGSDNAYTEWEYTVYHLTIPQTKLWPALDRLAQFFIAPLLLESAVERELQAIESEFQLHKNSDSCRWEQLLSCTAHLHEHDVGIAKFAWGNLRSLRNFPERNGVRVMEELRKFYDSYYCATNMRVVVQGAFALDEMQRQVTSMFGPVPAFPRVPSPSCPVQVPPDLQQDAMRKANKADQTKDSSSTATVAGPASFPPGYLSWEKSMSLYQSPMQHADTPWQASSLGNRVYRIVPVKDRPTLTISWPVPPVWQEADWYKAKVWDTAVAHLLGHEAEGSLLSYFQEKQWAVSCSAGIGDEGSECASSHALFVFQFTLSTTDATSATNNNEHNGDDPTEEGSDVGGGLIAWPAMVAAVYQYIGMLRGYCAAATACTSSAKGNDTSDNNSSALDAIYQEMRTTARLSYRYGDEPCSEDVVDGLVQDMALHVRNFPAERRLDGSSLLTASSLDTEHLLHLLETYLVPENARIDLTSRHFGQPTDFSEQIREAQEKTDETTDTMLPEIKIQQEEQDTTAAAGNVTDDSKKGADGESSLLRRAYEMRSTFNPKLAGHAPQVEPMFGTVFWCHSLPDHLVPAWDLVLTETTLHYQRQRLPPDWMAPLALPPANPFVPRELSLKPFPEHDAPHVLLGSCIQLREKEVAVVPTNNGNKNNKNSKNKKNCKKNNNKKNFSQPATTTAKWKQWYTATIVQYHSKTNAVRVLYQDDYLHHDDFLNGTGDNQKSIRQEQLPWHVLDQPRSEFTLEALTTAAATNNRKEYCFQGSMDRESIQYRVLAIALPGSGHRGGGVTPPQSPHAEFPPIPPPSMTWQCPKEVPCSSPTLLKLWHVQDRTFTRPISDLRIEIHCATANATPLARAAADLWADVVSDTLMSNSWYLAGMAELSASIGTTDTGFDMCIRGFDEQLHTLLETTLQTFFACGCGRSNDDKTGSVSVAWPDCIPPGRFQARLEVLLRKYKNAGMSAGKLCSNLRLQALRTNLWSPEAKRRALLEYVQHEREDEVNNSSVQKSFAKMVQLLFQQFAMEALYHGNVTRQDAHACQELILNVVHRASPTAAGGGNGGGSSHALGLARKKYPSQSVFRIPSSSVVATTTSAEAVSREAASIPRIRVPAKDATEPNTAVQVYIQVGKDTNSPQTIRTRVLLDLLVHLMDEPLYDQIRTKDQFGYEVYCDVRWTFGIMGLIVGVVSDTHTADQIVRRILQFWQDFRHTTLEQMSAEDYMDHVVGLATQKLEMLDCMRDETDSWWGEIRDGRFDWQAWRKEAVLLQELTLRDVCAFFDEYIVAPMPVEPTEKDNHDDKNDKGSKQEQSRRRNMLVVQVIGGSERAEMVEDENQVDDTIQRAVQEFHALCKQQTWGRVNCKLC